MPAASSRASHSARVAVAVSALDQPGERLAMRHAGGVVEKRGSVIHSGWPSSGASFSNVRWFAAPTVM